MVRPCASSLQSFWEAYKPKHFRHDTILEYFIALRDSIDQLMFNSMFDMVALKLYHAQTFLDPLERSLKSVGKANLVFND